MSTLERLPAVVATYFEAVNQRDWEAMATLFADDVEFRPAGSEVRRGRDDVLAYYPALLAGFDEHHDRVARVHVDGAVVVVEIAFEGTTSTGAPVAFEAVDVFDLDPEGRIARLSLWYDTRAVGRQVRAGAKP